jgi:hypothetical protein
MLRRLAVPDALDVLPSRTEVRRTTALGLCLGSLDVITTAEHLLVPPIVDGNPFLLALSDVSPWVAYGGFLVWFLLVAAVALGRTGALGYSADAYLLCAFSLAGLANAAYLLFGTMAFKNFVTQYTAFAHLYIVVLVPLGSVVVGHLWANRRRLARVVES